MKFNITRGCKTPEKAIPMTLKARRLFNYYFHDKEYKRYTSPQTV